jgi:hypothetical protein
MAFRRETIIAFAPGAGVGGHRLALYFDCAIAALREPLADGKRNWCGE